MHDDKMDYQVTFLDKFDPCDQFIVGTKWKKIL